ARRVADALAPEASSPYLAEQARLLAADIALSQMDHRAAITHLDALMLARPLVPERALLLAGRAQAAAGDRTAAALAYTRVYYEFPLSNEASAAATELTTLRDIAGAGSSRPDTVQLELGRAERLYASRKYSEARASLALIRDLTGGEDRALVDVRLGQIAFHTGRHAEARTSLAAHTRRGPREAEARYFDLLALRETGQGTAFVGAVRALVRDMPSSTWSADALDALATYHVRADEDGAAARVFTELFDQFPSSDKAQRAAWMAGWHAYRSGNHPEAIRIFERAAADFPRSDQRPAWLYWSARSQGEAGSKANASARHKLVLTDYAHSYYGRQSARRLGVAQPVFDVARAADRRSTRSTEQTAREALPAGLIIHRLLRAGLYDDALGELRVAERAGTTRQIQATIAWATREKGDLLRASVLMKRAYPQYLSAAGAGLPDDVLRVTYPVNYWNLIKTHATARNLDPYLIAALIAQESGYEPSARSAADAWGLMQVVPATGRMYARKLGIRGFTTRSLTDPEINIRIGTAYFADQVASLGSVHAALAGYNAGPTRARRWAAQKPGLERDEWIDDIPFPETQFYVKRIIGTAEDYRALYSGGFDPALKRTAARPRGASGNQ
ncbi:MAG: transglycosylase SLT domain-containing protein, partial [Acidobacteriota bacterium]|nr:transglycosylase SLT domain-containing protein [Acidobacteriota bacterium]